jgi:hypothetical protein
MATNLTIPRKQDRDTAVDYQQLYLMGVRHVQRLSSRIWTDYNVHDPGITTLELLCYALTDLGYRASFPMADLLAADGKTPEPPNALFTVPQIMPNRPLTTADYRKLLIDIKGIKNAWLKRSSYTCYADTVTGELLREKPDRPGIEEVSLAGLYDVCIEYPANLSVAAKKAALQAAQDRLRANRNLCEDFVNFREVEPESFLACAELELAHDADVATVKAECLFRIQQYLSPPVRFHSLSEMLSLQKTDGTGFSMDEIFTGPLLDSGFIDDGELAAADLRTEIHLSDLIAILMEIDGVTAVRRVTVSPEDPAKPSGNGWMIPVTDGKKATLDFDKSRLVFYKLNMPVEPDDPGQVTVRLADLDAAAKSGPAVAMDLDLTVQAGKFRQPAAYYSFQNHFPEIYGLGAAGSPPSGDARSRTLARQLKGYLLFFDQIMANYFAQLSRVKDLLSTDPELSRTYFSQVVDSFRDFEKIYLKTDVMAADDASIADQALLESPLQFLDRRNRFLDHLIARFAERFTEYAAAMYASFGAKPESMISSKCEFLQNYCAIGRDRGGAYNYSLKDEAGLWNSDNVSGLERRLARLLGIRNFNRRNLSDIAYDIYAEVDKTPDDEFRFRVRRKETGKIILSSPGHYPTEEMARDAMGIAVKGAMQPAGFDRRQARDGRFYFNIIDGSGEILARRIEYFNDSRQMEEEINSTMDYLEARYSDEGMFVIESILLRPDRQNDPFLPICAASNRYVDQETDPYSYRLHIILPAEGGRFANMDFRRYAEEVIREETPAHILPRICWIDGDDMALLEKTYRDWIYLKAGADNSARRDKLTRFIYSLFAVKNAYPKEILRECGSGDKFILNRTALGTLSDK